MMKERILQIMRRENMTQQEFAKAIEVSPASLSNIFNGKNQPDEQSCEVRFTAVFLISI